MDSDIMMIPKKFIILENALVLVTKVLFLQQIEKLVIFP